MAGAKAVHPCSQAHMSCIRMHSTVTSFTHLYQGTDTIYECVVTVIATLCIGMRVLC